MGSLHSLDEWCYRQPLRPLLGNRDLFKAAKSLKGKERLEESELRDLVEKIVSKTDCRVALRKNRDFTKELEALKERYQRLLQRLARKEKGPKKAAADERRGGTAKKPAGKARAGDASKKKRSSFTMQEVEREIEEYLTGNSGLAEGTYGAEGQGLGGEREGAVRRGRPEDMRKLAQETLKRVPGLKPRSKAYREGFEKSTGVSDEPSFSRFQDELTRAMEEVIKRDFRKARARAGFGEEGSEGFSAPTGRGGGKGRAGRRKDGREGRAASGQRGPTGTSRSYSKVRGGGRAGRELRSLPEPLTSFTERYELTESQILRLIEEEGIDFSPQMIAARAEAEAKLGAFSCREGSGDDETPFSTDLFHHPGGKALPSVESLARRDGRVPVCDDIEVTQVLKGELRAAFDASRKDLEERYLKRAAEGTGDAYYEQLKEKALFCEDSQGGVCVNKERVTYYLAKKAFGDAAAQVKLRRASRVGSHPTQCYGKNERLLDRTENTKRLSQNLALLATMKRSVFRRAGTPEAEVLHEEDLVEFGSQKKVSYSVVVAMDTSGAVQFSRRIEGVRRAGLSFAYYLRKKHRRDRIAFVEYNDCPREIQFKDIPVLKAVNGAGKNIGTCLKYCADRVRADKGRIPVIILIGDGLPCRWDRGGFYDFHKNNRDYLEDAYKQSQVLRRHGIVFNFVQLEDDRILWQDMANEEASKIASHAGGILYRVTDPMDIAPLLVENYSRMRLGVC
jgi:Mg-chelatase subunit ChlD